MVGREREFEAQGEKVITAVSRVDLRVIMAATLVQDPSLQRKCSVAVTMETESGSTDSASPKQTEQDGEDTHKIEISSK